MKHMVNTWKAIGHYLWVAFLVSTGLAFALAVLGGIDFSKTMGYTLMAFILVGIVLELGILMELIDRKINK